MIDIAILDYASATVRLVTCDIPDNVSNETIETELKLLGYKMTTIDYMAAKSINLIDEREN